MSHAANPNKAKKSAAETAAAAAERQRKADRERIRRVIITVGDDNKKVVGQIKGLVGALEDDVELHGDLMLETVLECAKNLPLKTGIYAAWVARMFDKHGAWVVSVISKALDEFRAAVRVGRLLPSQLLLRFFVCLGNVGLVPLSSTITLLQEVLSLSDGLRPSKGGDLGVFLTLASLPYMSPKAYEKVAEQVDSLVAGAGTYLKARDARWKPLIRLIKTQEPMDRLEAAAEALRSLKAAGWVAKSVFHVPGTTEPSIDGPEAAPKLEPLAVTPEEIRKSKVRLQVPLNACRLVTTKLDGGVDTQLPDHDRWALEDYILTTIEAFSRDVDECAKQLLRFPLDHRDFEAVLAESVLSQLVRLPSPPFLPLFYCRLLQALVEKQESMLNAIELGYSGFFAHIPDLDEECLEVLAEAWAYHLMCRGYKADWSPFLGDNVPVQTQRFARRALERLMRLSFHQNLTHQLPKDVHVYVPPEPVPASGLPAQAKPEFPRMMGMVKIKEPDEKKVLKYCNRLLKLQPKEEQEDEEPKAPREEAKEDMASGKTPADEKGAAVSAPAQEEENEAEYGGEEDNETKEVQADEAKMEDNPGEGAAKRPAEGGEETLPEAKRPRVRVKEETKPEDDAGTGVKGPPANATATDEKADEEAFGSVPAEPWPLEAVVELFVMALLQHGSKTPTHMSRILDGHQQVFAKLQPNGEDEAHRYAKVIVRCIFEFWRLSGQRLEITLDTLVHRGVVTARAVVEHALAARTPQVCDWMSTWNMINSVARKSLERTQSVRAELAVAKKLEKADLLEKHRKQLDAAIQETAELFTLIFTDLVRSHQDFEDQDQLLRHITSQRVLMIGRKYHVFIKPLIEASESRIPGVAHNPEISAIFQSLRSL